MSKIEGWYDARDNYHAGRPDSPDASERLVIDFGGKGEHDYKTIHPNDWEYDDWDDLLEQAEDWYDHEYGEATG